MTHEKTGPLSFLDSRRFTRQLTPEKRQEIYQKIRDRIGLSEFSLKTTAFDEHSSKRVQDHTGFKLQIGEDKENTFDKVLNGPDASELRKKFKEIFEKEPFYDRAKNSFNESMAAFKEELVKQVPIPYEPHMIKGGLGRIRDNARNAISAQHKKELDRFKKELENPAFLNKLQAALKIDAPDKATKVKEDLIKELEESHKNQLKTFDTTAAENETVFDTAQTAQMNKYIMGHQLNDWAMQLDPKKRQEMILEIAAAESLMQERIGISSDMNKTAIGRYDKSGASISAVDPNDLNFAISLTGKKIHHDKKKNVWTLEMPPRILDPGYYCNILVDQEKPKVDLLTMALLVKASGFNGIIMTVQFSDPETQKQRLREAYEACLEAGFEEKKIVLKDGSGKEINPATIFNGDELSLLHAQAAKRREVKNPIPKEETPPEITTRMRNDVLNYRNRGKTEEEKVTLEKEKELEEEVTAALGPNPQA